MTGVAPRYGLAVIAAFTLSACDQQSKPVELSSVAEAPAHHDAKLLEFSGRVRSDLRGVETLGRATNSKGVGTSSPGGRRYRVVVPVVPHGWEPAQPVPLWITHVPRDVGSDGDPSAWLERAQSLQTEASVGKVVDYAGREPGMRTVSAWQKAVRNAEQAHGIQSDPHAPIVTWPAP